MTASILYAVLDVRENNMPTEIVQYTHAKEDGNYRVQLGGVI